MSLNTLTQKVFATTLALIIPNLGCNTQQTETKEKVAQALPITGTLPDSELCNGLPAMDRANCQDDQKKNRDCRALRQEGEKRIDEIPDIFTCKNGELKNGVGFGGLMLLDDFTLPLGLETRGDCTDVERYYRQRMLEILGNLSCDGRDSGQPYKFGHEEPSGERAKKATLGSF